MGTYLALFSGGIAATWLLSRLLSPALEGLVVDESRRVSGARSGDTRRLALLAVGLVAVAVGVAALVAGRPIFGLLVSIPLPWALRAAAAYRRGERSRRLEEAAIAALHALRGLLRSGLSLPAALFQLARRLPSPYTEELRRSLERFDGGRSLGACLARFRERSALPRAGAVLAAMEVAYAEGLPLLPLLDGQLPVLEAEYRGAERLRSLRRSLAVQIAVVSLLPWALAAALAVFQPELLARFRESPLFLPSVGGATALEATGAWWLWRVSVFL